MDVAGTDASMENLERVLSDALDQLSGNEYPHPITPVEAGWNRSETRRYVATSAEGDQVAVAVWGDQQTRFDDDAVTAFLQQLCERLNLRWNGLTDAELVSPVAVGVERGDGDGGLAVVYSPHRRPGSSMRRLHDVEMTVTAELGRTRMKLKSILDLTPGAVVELDRVAGSPIDVLVNGRAVARGEVVVVDEEFGVRITEILSDGDE